MKKVSANTFALIAGMLALGAPYLDIGKPVKNAKQPKMPLTDDEIETMRSLEGKKRKLYIKSLKEKYGK